MQIEKNPQFHALLIGIDCYLPNVLSNNVSYPPLHGCVRDVQMLAHFFHNRLRYRAPIIKTLMASHSGKAGVPQEKGRDLPTYVNIVRALHELRDTAQRDDIVWIYFAGHGGRTSTLYPEVKGQYGYDESLVPLDIGSAGTQYLRDIELGLLLKQMVEKGLIVTLVLDCCHAGGATRGPSLLGIRSIDAIDRTPRLTESLVAPREQLIEAWRTLQVPTERGLQSHNGWLPEPRGYVLLAACDEHDPAYERQEAGYWTAGLFTTCLLEVLRQMPESTSYKMLHELVRTRVHKYSTRQTPLLEGERSRIVFGKEHLKAEQLVTVMAVERDAQGLKVELDAGHIQLLQEGAQCWIYPNPGRVEVARQKERLAFAELTEVGATFSQALIVEERATLPVEPGDQARIIAHKPFGAPLKVYLQHNAGTRQRSLEQLEKVLMRTPFVELVPSGAEAFIVVTIAADGTYELHYADGAPVPYLRPAIASSASDCAERLSRRLIHLAKYQRVKELENPTPPVDLQKTLHISWERRAGDGTVLANGESSNGAFLKVGEKLALTLHNVMVPTLHIAIISLAHDWSIMQLQPRDQGSFVLEYGEKKPFVFRVDQSSDYHRQANDLIKIFIARDPTDCSWLTLPALDQPPTPKRGTRAPLDPLTSLFAALFEDAPATRSGLRLIRPPQRDWNCIELEVHIRKR